MILVGVTTLDFSPPLAYTISALQKGLFYESRTKYLNTTVISTGRITRITNVISYGMKTPNKTLLVLTLGILTFSLFPDLAHESYGKQGGFLIQAPDFEELTTYQGSSLLPIAAPKGPDRVVRTVSVVVTAYSSTTWQTDDSPFITASGTTVREGVAAANFLPIGTRIKLPDLYGDRIFVVEDRMHPRQKYVVDIWFPSYSEALNFGAKYTKIQVIEG